MVAVRCVAVIVHVNEALLDCTLPAPGVAPLRMFSVESGSEIVILRYEIPAEAREAGIKVSA